MANEYETVGEDGQVEGDEYATGWEAGQRAMQLYRAPAGPRPVPATPIRRPQPTYRQPAPRPAPAPAPIRPAGLTAEQVRAIAQEEIRRGLPYGDVPARPHTDEAMFPMGLGFITLTSVTPVLTLEARPQRAFRGERLVLEAFPTAGALGVFVRVSEFTVGDYRQLVGDGDVSIGVFAPDAFGVRLMLDASIPGVLFRVELVGLAIPAGESIVISGSVIGRAGEAAQR